MLRIVVLAALVLGATLSVASPAQAICAKAVEWHGATYLAVPSTVTAPAAGRRLTGGQVPVCQDVIGDDPPPEVAGRPIALFRVRGVSTGIAVRTRGGLYVSPGCLAKLSRGRAGRPGRVNLVARCGA